MLPVYILLGIILLIGILIVFGRVSEPVDRHGISDESIRQLARQGKRIQAIKQYRILHGVGLKRAKDAVDAMIREA